MAAPTLPEVMDALDARLATIDGLRHSAHARDTITPPHAMVLVPGIENYRETFSRGTVLVTWKILLLVSKSFDRIAQATLAGYASWTGANSIPLAIEGDLTLGGTVHQVVVDSFVNLGMVEVNTVPYLGGEFTGRFAASGV